MNHLGECKSCRNAAIVAALECRSALLKSLRPYTVFTLVSFLFRLVSSTIQTFRATPQLSAIFNFTESIMAFPTAAAYGMSPPTTALNDVVHTLNHAGFGNEDICMMLSPTHPIAGMVREAGLHECDRQASSVAAKLIGWLSEFGAVMIPSVGFFIRSQAFFHALLSGQDAPGLCGQSTTLAGLGFNARDAFRFEEQLRHAGVLVYVACAGNSKSDWAMELLRRTGAREAATLETEEEAVAVA